MTLPGAPHLAYRDGRLHLEDCALEDLARRFGTPLYVYSRSAMRGAAMSWQQALAGRRHLVCYAMKANPSLAVLETFMRAGCGFDIVSGGELARVLAAGADAGRVVFSGVGKSRGEMRQALEAGVRCFNVESEGELEVLAAVAADAGHRAPVSLRVNPDVDPGTHPYISTGLRNNKFGVAHDRARATYRRAAALPALRVVGIDCHIGSQITEIAPYLDALDRLLDLVEEVESDGATIEHLDLGGGLGITYADERPPAVGDLVAAVLERLDARGHGHRELLFEPGRSMVGNAGVLLGEVLYLKPADDAQSRDFCIVDMAMNDLMRPAMYEAWMGIVPLRAAPGPAATERVWDVVGPICESGDWLGRERALALQPGDLLAILSAGAYGMSMASNYNSRPRAAEVLVDGDRAWLIRERESIASLFAGEHRVGD